ncbi:MAG: DUF3892 domain-containing protein [Dokdonella sp.]
MATSLRISCINKMPRADRHKQIMSVGGVDQNGKRWKLATKDAIAAIENGTLAFYVMEADHRAEVIVALHNGHKYLKTENDGVDPDNLLNLREC